jgi:transposase
VDILKQNLKKSARKLKLGRKGVFQMDNDPKHTSKVVAKWLKDNKVKVLERPSQSPYLNPIENVWAELEKRVRARMPTFKLSYTSSVTLTQLHQLCQEEWAKIHPIYVGSLWKAPCNWLCAEVVPCCDESSTWDVYLFRPSFYHGAVQGKVCLS